MASKTISAPLDVAVLATYADAKANLEAAKAAEARCRDAVLALMGDADEIVCEGSTVVTYREVESSRFDVAGVKASDPETYAKWLVSSVANRFLWKGFAA